MTRLQNIVEGLEKKWGQCNIKLQTKMANYEIVEFIAIMQSLIGGKNAIFFLSIWKALLGNSKS